MLRLLSLFRQALGRNATLWWLGAILLVALALRLYGLDWDQGYLFHPDERAILMKTWDLSWPRDLAQFLDPNGSPLNSHWFPYGTFPLYLLKFFSFLATLLDRGFSLVDSRLLGRALSVLFDMGTVFLVFLVGSKLHGRRVGLLGAGLVALAVLHIQLSHFYATDGLLTFFIMLTVLALLGAMRKAGAGSAALAGLGLGLALATKVSALPLLLPVGLAYGIYAFSREGDTFSWAPSEARLKAALRGLAITLAVAAAVFLIVEPYALLDWKTFRSDIVEQSEMVRRVRDYPYTRQYVDTPSYLYQVEQLATWGLGLPLGLVAWGGLAFTLYAAWRRRGKADLLLLSWVVPYFLVIGSFQVKFLRYLLPLTPFLILMGANMLFRGRDWARDKRVTLEALRKLANGSSRWGWASEKGYWLVGLVIPLVVLLSLFYSLAYVSIYSQPHPAVRASQWLRQNAPAGATVLKEHWEEGLPALGAYRVKELNLYDPDGAQKLEHLVESLSEGDYLALYSNRLYGTIPRLRERYPLTSHYYQLLFSGELGYELAYSAVSYPRFLGLELVDDTFQRPRLPEPAALASYQGSPLTLRWGAADESFTVYDHPKVMVFRKAKALPRGELMQRLSQMGTTSQRRGLLLSEDEARAQREGGTWSQLFPRDSLPNRFPVLSWLLLVEALSLAALPLGFILFRPLPDRGYPLIKVLALLLVAYLTWLGASLRLLPFSQTTILLAAALVVTVSAAVFCRRRQEITAALKSHWRLILLVEGLFLAAFLSFYLLRLINPDLWHPYRGGEKPMEFAYLNAILKSTYMPPYDPWFSGGYINYYYFGQFLIATPIKLLGIVPSVAYNLAIPLLFALVFTAAFSLSYNLVAAARKGQKGWAAPLGAGLAGAIFVAIIGNLDGAGQLLQGAWRSLTTGAALPPFDFWRSSRVITSVDGHEITEFPFFTFLFADLHAHLISLVLTLLVAALALGLVLRKRSAGATAPDPALPQKALSACHPERSEGSVLGRREVCECVYAGGTDSSVAEFTLERSEGLPQNDSFGAKLPDPEGGVGGIPSHPGGSGGSAPRAGALPPALSRFLSPANLLLLGTLSLALGAVRITNTWDYPTYFLLAGIALAIADLRARGKIDPGFFFWVLLQWGMIYALSSIFFQPFHQRYEQFYFGVDPSPAQTPLHQYLIIHGLFLLALVSYLALQFGQRFKRAGLLRYLAGAFRHWQRLPRYLSLQQRRERSRPEVGLIAVYVFLALATYGALLFVLSPTVSAYLVPLLGLVLLLALGEIIHRGKGFPLRLWVLGLAALALGIGLAVEMVAVKGDIGRMNTVFKFYVQAWVLMALVSAFALWWVTRSLRGAWRWTWLGAFTLLLLASLVYTVAGTRVRLEDRFGRLPPTGDGMAYMAKAVYRDEKGPLELVWDYQAIQWLQDHVPGSPVIIEGVTPQYRWGSRISIYTGLPAVAGWDWEQKQQRWAYQGMVDERQRDVASFYSDPDPAKAEAMLRKYGVSYVYVGPLERLYYPRDGLAKFERMDTLEIVYRNSGVAVYRVKGS